VIRQVKLLLIFLVLIICVAGISALLFLDNSNTSGNAKLDILVAPSGSQLKLDGKNIKSGIRSVAAGEHTVSVSKGGFAGQEEKIEAIKDQSVFVGIILKSNSPQTANWYKSNDINLVQSINNQLYDQSSKKVVKSNPLATKLPYIGPGLNYRIDYGASTSGSKTNQVGIYIRYRTDQDKQAALDWIKSQGVDPSSLDIVYLQGNF